MDDLAVGISSGQVQIVQCNQGDGPGIVEYYVYSALAEEVFAIENRSGPVPIRDRSGCPKFVVEVGPDHRVLCNRAQYSSSLPGAGTVPDLHQDWRLHARWR